MKFIIEKKKSFTEWKLLRKNYLNSYLFLDGYKFVDGIYQFKLIANDRLSNSPNDIYYQQAISSLQIFDNSPPMLENLKIEKNQITFQVVDNLSHIKSVKYTYDKVIVTMIPPLDGVLDSKKETFVLKNKKPELVLIIKDASDNILYSSIER
jgi:hypothetical protein